MPDASASAADLPEQGRSDASAGATLEHVAGLADGCRACDLWARATQTVFGTGPTPAPVMLVGDLRLIAERTPEARVRGDG